MWTHRLCQLPKPLLRLLLGGLFIYAAYSKVMDPASFADAVANYRVLPHPTIHATALLIPAIELVCGCLLIAGLWRSEAYGWLVILGVAFAVSQTQAILRGLDITCGCFGPDHNSPLTVGKLLLNWVLLAILILMFFGDRRSSHEGDTG